MTRSDEVSPEVFLRCPLCRSDSLRLSHAQGFGEVVRTLLGVRMVRCMRCLHRFGAFAPRLRKLERRREVTLFQPRADQSIALSPHARLAEIQAIEAEWQRAIQPATVIEQTYCAQLAQATWHLRCINEVERETMAEAVRRGSFNGENARQVMEWRRSTEASIQRALDHLQNYRQAAAGPAPALRRSAPELPDLGRLAKAVGTGVVRPPAPAMTTASAR